MPKTSAELTQKAAGFMLAAANAAKRELNEKRTAITKTTVTKQTVTKTTVTKTNTPKKITSKKQFN